MNRTLREAPFSAASHCGPKVPIDLEVTDCLELSDASWALAFCGRGGTGVRKLRGNKEKNQDQESGRVTVITAGLQSVVGGVHGS